MQDSDKICLCFGVTKRQLEKFIRLEKPVRHSQLSECYGAGTGCGWCRPFLKNIFDSKLASNDSTSELLEITPQEYERRRAEYRKKKDEESI